MAKRLTSLILSLIIVLPLVYQVVVAPVSVAAENLITNPSAEVQTGSQPQDWLQGNWGTNSANFSYANDGQDGSRSLTVTMTAHSSGDAKWYFTPVSVQPNQQYFFSDFYKSDVETFVVAQVEDASQNYSYFYMGSAAASANWTQLNLSITTPANASKMTVFHLIERIGSLQTDNYSLTSTTAPTPSPSPTPTATPSPSPTPSPTATPSPSPSPTPSPTATPSPTPTPTPTPSPTATPSPSPSPTPTPDPSNLIANASLENGGSTPTSWFSNKWGTNSVQFTYPSEAQDGSRGAQVNITSYASGDAKWYFAPVNVQAGTEYVFKDYYKANVASEIVGQSQDSNGNFTYFYIGNLPAANSWTQANFSFTTPANATKLTIFHLIASVGQLNVDNFSLIQKASTPISVVDNVPNNSVEQADTNNQNLPLAWHTNKWGSNSATFTYLNNFGYNSSRSVKTQVTSYSSGDAKWYYDPQPVIAGQTINISNHYQSNTTTEIVVMVTNTDQSLNYYGIATLPASDEVWSSFNFLFTVPAGAQSMTVFHSLISVGYLITDDYHAGVFTPGTFDRGLVTLTFDDGWESQYANARPTLQQYNYPATFYISTGILGEADYMVNSQVQALKNAGHQISAHTVSHPHLPSLTDAQIQAQLGDSQAYLQTNFATDANDFASPFGEVDSRVMSFVRPLYATHRGVQSGFNYNDNTFDIYNLKVQNITNITTTAEVQSWVEQAKADKSWLILVYHAIINNPDTYDVSVAEFSSQMQALSQSGVAVVTLDQALAELLPQL